MIKHTDLFYFHVQLNWPDWSRFRSRSFWSRSYNSFLVSVSVLVSHSLVSVLALVSLCSGFINSLVLMPQVMAAWRPINTRRFVTD